MLDMGSSEDGVAVALLPTDQGDRLILAKSRPPSLRDVVAASALLALVVQPGTSSWVALCPFMLQQCRAQMTEDLQALSCTLKLLPVGDLAPLLDLANDECRKKNSWTGSLTAVFPALDSPNDLQACFTSVYQKLDALCAQVATRLDCYVPLH